MSIVKGTKGLSLNIQHDYITLRTPNGNYTTSWSGAKASGKLAAHKTAFNNIDKFVQTKIKSISPLDAMKLLLEPNVLSSLWNEWNEEVKSNDFKVGENVLFNPTSLFAKKFPKGGTVKSVSRKNVFIHLLDKNETIGFDYQTLIRK